MSLTDEEIERATRRATLDQTSLDTLLSIDLARFDPESAAHIQAAIDGMREIIASNANYIADLEKIRDRHK